MSFGGGVILKVVCAGATQMLDEGLELVQKLVR